VVVIQSDLLDALATRLTIPLAELDPAITVPTALCPVITVKGTRLHKLAHYAHPFRQKPCAGQWAMSPHRPARWW
jgi:toxin CcdB